jgi:rhamnulokinase
VPEKQQPQPTPNSQTHYPQHPESELVRSIVESLSLPFVDAVQMASQLSGKSESVIHIVGGGSQNELLCQQITDRSGMPLLAGQVEAKAIGNVSIEAPAQSFVEGLLESLPV